MRVEKLTTLLEKIVKKKSRLGLFASTLLFAMLTATQVHAADRSTDSNAPEKQAIVTPDETSNSQALSSAGPLNQITISPTLNCTVFHVKDSHSQFFGDSACGTFVAVGSSLYAPSIPAGTFGVTTTSYTPVSGPTQTGSGTNSDPFKIVTVVRAISNGLLLSEEDSYILGSNEYRTRVTVTNERSALQGITLYRAGDCYLQGSDNGFGQFNQTNGAIACVGKNATGGPGTRLLQWRPVTPGSRYLEAGYSQVWAAIGSRLPLSNQCLRCSESIDNGAALSWSDALNGGQSKTYEHTTSFDTGSTDNVVYASLGDSYTSGEGLVPEDNRLLRYDCGTDLHAAQYFENTTVEARVVAAYGNAVLPVSTYNDCDTVTGAARPDLNNRAVKNYENLCHRNGDAYPNRIREALGIQFQNFLFAACSGAITRNFSSLLDAPGFPGSSASSTIEYPDSPRNVAGGELQLTTLLNFQTARGIPDVLTVGIGGNDTGFVEILKRCLLGDCTDEQYRRGILLTIDQTTYPRLLSLFTKLRTNYPQPKTRIFAFGYPKVLSKTAAPCAGTELPVYISTSSGLGRTLYPYRLEPNEIAWAADVLIPELNQAVRDAATAAGLTFVDIFDTTTGHEICTDEPWVNGLRLGDDGDYRVIANESFHPNQLAHAKIAQRFLDLFTRDQLLNDLDPVAQTVLRPNRPFQTSLIVNQPSLTDAVCVTSSGCQPGLTYRSVSPLPGLSGANFPPGVTVTFTANSNPVVLGSAVADANGVATLPAASAAAVEPGFHSLVLRANVGNKTYEAAGLLRVLGATTDGDKDGLLDAVDNCVDTSNPAQTDSDGDGIGDACDLSSGLRSGGFHSLSPTRILDTRTGVGLQGPVVEGISRRLKVTGLAGVPEGNVTAVVLNVTATNATASSFLSIWPGGAKPNTSNLNFQQRTDAANLVVARVSSDGTIAMDNAFGSVDVIADVAGWFDTGGFTADVFNGTDPLRLLDTRNGIGSAKRQLSARSSISVPISGQGAIPRDASAVVVNITATNQTADSFLTVWPGGESRPNASNLNFRTGQNIANLGIVKLGPSGDLQVYNEAGSTDVLFDIVGYFSSDDHLGERFEGLIPTRLVDSRNGIGTSGAWASGETRSVSVSTGVPLSAKSVILNLTATNTTQGSYLSVWPKGTTQPTVSSLNWVSGGTTRPNLVVVKIGDDRSISIFNASGTSDVIADVVGWTGG